MKNMYLLFIAFVMFSCTNDTNVGNETCIEFETAGIEQIEPAVTIDMVGRPYNVFFRVKKYHFGKYRNPIKNDVVIMEKNNGKWIVKKINANTDL